MRCWEVAEQGFQPRLPKGSRTQTGSRQLAEPSEDWTLSVPKALGNHWRLETDKSKIRIIFIKVTCGVWGWGKWDEPREARSICAEAQEGACPEVIRAVWSVTSITRGWQRGPGSPGGPEKHSPHLSQACGGWGRGSPAQHINTLTMR